MCHIHQAVQPHCVHYLPAGDRQGACEGGVASHATMNLVLCLVGR